MTQKTKLALCRKEYGITVSRKSNGIWRWTDKERTATTYAADIDEMLRQLSIRYGQLKT